MSEVRGGSQLLFIVYRDKSGQYITLDGDAKVQATIGKVLLGRKYRTCDAVKKETASTPPSATQPEPTADAGALLMDPKFKSAYYKALGPMVKENWLAKLDGPAPLNKKVKVGGTEYVLASACKNHDCADNNTVLLYRPHRGWCTERSSNNAGRR